MKPETISYILGALSLVAAIYAVWTAWYFTAGYYRLKKELTKNAPNREDSPKRKGDIIGKSRFTLPLSGQSQPEAAVEPEKEKDTEKENNFAQSNVPEHPRMVPSDELDEVFGSTPQGEKNEPMEIEVPLSDNSNFPDEGEADETEDFEDETEELPTRGAHSALGVSFEQMGEAYRQVVHNPSMTEKEEEETGRVFLEIRETDMFEAIVSQSEEGDRINYLMETYMAAFQRELAARNKEDNPLSGSVPSDFDVRQFL
jgi:hypothetical protein